MDKKEVYVKVTKDGPYLVYGTLDIHTKVIETDENGVCINYGDNKTFNAATEPIALCRCGNSKNAPFCDASHLKIEFDGTETASFEPILDGAIKYEGPVLTLYDNEQYCAYARFCDAHGSIWRLIFKDDEDSKIDVIREANLCPSGRLMVYDKNGNPIENEQPVSIDLLEDDGLKLSGPIWVRGGIKIESEDGKCYEIRNRQTLCRCGKSKNKPFCDCSHAHIGFKAQYQE